MKFLTKAKQGESRGSYLLPRWIGAGLIVLALVLCALPQAAVAQVEPQPCRFWGTVKVDGDWVADDTLITALIDGATVSWWAKTFTPKDPDPYVGKSVYVVTVSGDKPWTQPKDGGIDGDIVRFRVTYGDTDYQAAQTGIWEWGGFVWVDLAINTATPVAILTGQPTGWVTYGTANITVGGEGVEKYKYRLDDGAWSDEFPVSEHIVLADLSEGWHTVYVIGGNAGWQPEDLATVASWGVDTTPPDTPSLMSPENGSRIDNTTPTFSWTPVENPTGVSYTLWVDDNADFSSPLWIETCITSEYTVPGSNPLLGSYHWRVKAVDGAGKESEWSAAWFFIVETDVETPLLVSPPDGAITADNMPTFEWSCDDTEGVTFILEIGSSDFDPDPRSPPTEVTKEGIIGLTYTLSADEALADDTYYWHVKTVKDGQESGWSEAWSITIKSGPPVATISGAPSGTVNYNTTDITVGGEGIVAYKYKLDDGAWSAETPVATHITLSGLGDGVHTLYVIGKNALGTWQAEVAATTATWTVITTAPVATLSGQPSGVVNYNTANITVGGVGIVAYKYKLDDGAWSAETLVTTNIVLSGLGDGVHTLYVRGKNALGTWQTEAAATTATWTVDTTAPTPPVATLSGQPSGRVNYNTADITVGGAGVVSYKYKLDDGDWSNERPVNTHIILSSLSTGEHTVYVIGKNALGIWQAEASATTASWTVDTTPPSAPTLLTPANEARFSKKTPTLDWSDVTDASGVTYSLQIDDNADFSSPIISRQGLTGSTYTLTGGEALSKGTYYWRVRAVDGAGNVSAWTAPFSFSVTAASKGMAAWVWVVIGLVVVAVIVGGLAYSSRKR
ncbi:MAG: hypothetical protein FJ012_01735 [Chloroflexi bacterium]|nr:hypothetical protein [Chloroflexota bacterium]